MGERVSKEVTKLSGFHNKKSSGIRDFSDVASDYEKRSLVQKSAAEILLGLIDIKKTEDVLDLGCGTGNLTERIRRATSRRVEGIDPSEEMIVQAKKSYQRFGIEFIVSKAEEIEYDREFDVIFCNSAFQWVIDPEKAVRNCHRALRDGGRMGIQAPATSNYSPTFVEAVKSVEQNPATKETFSHFKPPWFFMETSAEYRELFKKSGFTVALSEINTVKSRHSPEEAFGIFSSGAAVGYLNPNCYLSGLDSGYVSNFNMIVRKYFESMADENGLVELVFNRIFLIAIKYVGFVILLRLVSVPR